MTICWHENMNIQYYNYMFGVRIKYLFLCCRLVTLKKYNKTQSKLCNHEITKNKMGDKKIKFVFTFNFFCEKEYYL